jgi:predicted ATP-dependent endonuclease of OLD family
MGDVAEVLKIHNFLSIKEFDWEIKDFNIITGDMGSGKSLCIKLLKFFEDIIPELFVLPYEQFLSSLEYENLLTDLKKEFSAIFYFSPDDSNDRKAFTVEYKFLNEAQVIDITITGDNNAIHIKSHFLKNLLDRWKKYLERKSDITPDGFEEAKLYFYNELLKTFDGHFPIATTFIPASRAALAFGSGAGDNYLREYNDLMNSLHRFSNRGLALINSILKAKIIIDNGKLWLESNDGRKVPIAKASSGQQEIIYVLILLDKLGKFRYSYGKDQSLFIEEPSAHLFPLEQKQTIELITRIFISIKEERNLVRIFITTHSPYILNSMNNILKKGSLIEKYGDQADRIRAEVDIPHLSVNEISAYFLDSDGIGKSMIDENEQYLYNDTIAGISYSIDEDTRKLSELNNELLDDRGAHIG